MYCTNEILSVELKDVSFSGTKYHAVKKDDGSEDYEEPHWQDNSSPLDGDADDEGDRKYPVCFTRNTKMRVSAKWYIEPPDLDVTIKVKGDGPDNLDFPETTATINGNDLTITDVVCSNAFVNEVDFFDPMSIEWSFSVDGGSTWCDAGTSANQTYVTLDDPLTTVFHTLAHLGCKNAEGENTEANCTSKIWAEFTDRDVRRVDGVQLTYYDDTNCTNHATAQLLSTADGQCGAWADFLNDMFLVQGIDDADVIELRPKNSPWYNNTDQEVAFMSHGGIMVKNWSFVDPSIIWGDDTNKNWKPDDFEDSNNGSPYTPVSETWRYPYEEDGLTGSDIVEQSGVGGQGNDDPPSAFQNHAVIKRDGIYYDPSYGTSFTSLLLWQNGSLSGFGGIDPYSGNIVGGPVDSSNLQIEEY